MSDRHIHIDPGEQDHGRKKRRGLPAAKHRDQQTLFGGETAPPANVGPATKRFDPDTSRHAAARAHENITRKQLAVLTMFHRFGPMHDELLNRRYKEAFDEAEKSKTMQGLIPEQTESGVRSRRAELVELKYLEYAGWKSPMETGGKGKVHRVKRLD